MILLYKRELLQRPDLELEICLITCTHFPRTILLISSHHEWTMLSFNASSTITVTMHASPCKNPTVQTRETEEKGGIRRTKHWPPTLPAKAPAPTNRLARPLPFYHIQNSKWWQGLLISLSQIVSVLVMWKIRLCRPNEREPPYNRKKKKKTP